jgi:hypothetical protein
MGTHMGPVPNKWALSQLTGTGQHAPEACPQADRSFIATYIESAAWASPVDWCNKADGGGESDCMDGWKACSPHISLFPVSVSLCSILTLPSSLSFPTRLQHDMAWKAQMHTVYKFIYLLSSYPASSSALTLPSSLNFPTRSPSTSTNLDPLLHACTHAAVQTSTPRRHPQAQTWSPLVRCTGEWRT